MGCQQYLWFIKLHGGFMICTLIILENMKEILEYNKEMKREDLFIHLRISMAIIIILMNDINNASIILLTFSNNFKWGIFICCCIHSLSFIVFFLNILEENDIMKSRDSFDYILKLIFYGNLIGNSLSFIILTLFIILINLISLIYPNIQNYF